MQLNAKNDLISSSIMHESACFMIFWLEILILRKRKADFNLIRAKSREAE